MFGCFYNTFIITFYQRALQNSPNLLRFIIELVNSYMRVLNDIWIQEKDQTLLLDEQEEEGEEEQGFYGKE
jgi:hypothetical protein